MATDTTAATTAATVCKTNADCTGTGNCCMMGTVILTDTAAPTDAVKALAA